MHALDFLIQAKGLIFLTFILLACIVGMWMNRHSTKKYVLNIDMTQMPSGLRYKQKVDWIRSHRKHGEMSYSKAQAILREWEKSDQVHDMKAKEV